MLETAGVRWLRRIGLTLLAAFVTFPLYVMLSTSLEPLRDVNDAFHWLPRHITFSAYRQMWTTVPLAHYIENSVIISTASTLLALVVATPAAYVLSRRQVRGARAISIGLLGTQLAPAIFYVIPLFLAYAQFGRWTGLQVIGTRGSVVLTDLTVAVPFAVWMLTGYFRTVPTDLEDAAAGLGARPLRVLVSVVLPAAAPGMAATATFAFAVAWSDVLFAEVLTNDGSRTVAVGLPAYVGGPTVFWNQVMAASIVTAVPIVIVFLAARKVLIRLAVR